MDRGAWGGYSPRGCKESDTTEQLTLTSHKFITIGYNLQRDV